MIVILRKDALDTKFPGSKIPDTKYPRDQISGTNFPDTNFPEMKVPFTYRRYYTERYMNHESL